MNDAGMLCIFAHRSSAILLGASLGIALSQPASADEAVNMQPLQLAFHVDLIGSKDTGAALLDDVDIATPQAMEFNLIGLPVKFGMKEDDTAGGMGLQAGIRGDYELAISQKLTLNASATLAKTGYLDNSWGTDRATAKTSLSYRHEGLLLAFEPAWSLEMVETVVMQRDYGATARFARPLFQGMDLSGGVAYGRHDAWNPDDDYANASAYATLTYRLAGRMKLDLSYAATYKLPDQLQAGSLNLYDLPYAENSTGPTVTMAFPLGDSFDIAATYRYCRSTDELPSSGSERRVDDVQSFDMSAVWHSDDPDIGGIQFTAAYGYDRLSTNASNADEQSHAATLAMAIPF